MNWLESLSRLSVADLHRISRLVDLLIAAERARADQARVMLAAVPEPETCEEARERLEAIISTLEG